MILPILLLSPLPPSKRSISLSRLPIFILHPSFQISHIPNPASILRLIPHPTNPCCTLLTVDISRNMHYAFHSSFLWGIRWRWKKGILYLCNMLGVMQARDACCDFFPSKNVSSVFTVMDIGALWIKVGNEVDSLLWPWRNFILRAGNSNPFLFREGRIWMYRSQTISLAQGDTSWT